MLSLKWSQVDFHRKALQTTRIKTLKARTIPLNKVALELLTRRAKVKAISGHVFYNSVGNGIDVSKLKAAFRKAVTESGIDHFRFHDLRHTFATRMAQAGVDIYTVSKLLGHEDVSTTARHYAHHSTESLRRGVDVLDSVCYNSATVANGGLGERAVSR